MGRHKLCRRIGFLPIVKEFTPRKGDSNTAVTLTFSDFETIRLVDYLGYSHLEAAAAMQVSRATVTRLYENARKKIGVALVEGCKITIVPDENPTDYAVHCSRCHKLTHAPQPLPLCPHCHSEDLTHLEKNHKCRHHCQNNKEEK